MEKRRVLIVDYSEPCRKILVIYLGRAGFEVTAAKDAKEAIEALMQTNFCAVICNLILPTGSGLDVIKVLRRFDSRVFAVAVTGLISEEVRLQALGEGYDRFFFKPYRAPELIAMIPEEKAA